MKDEERNSEDLLCEEKEVCINNEVYLDESYEQNIENNYDKNAGKDEFLDDNNFISKDIDEEIYSVKSWSATLVLCILLGFIGFHRFYVGKAGTAILMLFTLGGFGIWILVDVVTIIINNFTDEDGKIIKRKCCVG
ncbi:TM2 domain-containing protein [Clostridium sp.]|uniref:TM2 domain-containing protein n=1 Tax=Clostridium sp. TaxID=1506 RepID=UPI00321772FF